jgi:uncharacterized membrane protein
LFIIIFAVVSCASRPKLYPNQKLKTVGKETAQKDIDKCISEGDMYLETSEAKRITKGAGKGAAVGAAMGAVFGAFTGSLGRGALQGGAVGAAGGGVATAMSPDQLKRRYVNHCLSEKGYHVLGWD